MKRSIEIKQLILPPLFHSHYPTSPQKSPQCKQPCRYPSILFLRHIHTDTHTDTHTHRGAGDTWLIPVILAVWEADIGRTKTRDQPGQLILKSPSLKLPEQNGLAQEVEHLLCKCKNREFKSQFHKKRKPHTHRACFVFIKLKITMNTLLCN
jgi:hypothetical protein